LNTRRNSSDYSKEEHNYISQRSFENWIINNSDILKLLKVWSRAVDCKKVNKMSSTGNLRMLRSGVAQGALIWSSFNKGIFKLSPKALLYIAKLDEGIINLDA
jgi:hypothetical protein